MRIEEFTLGTVYNRNELIESFKGAFQGGINICKATNTIVITSLHTGNRIYDDKLFDSDVMLYTGEGQVGDQQMIRGNKAILEAKDKGRDIHLFVRYKPTEYTYFGKVVLVGDPYYVDEKDINNNMRKVIKFPIMQLSAVRRMSPEELAGHHVAGVTPIEKPLLQVAGAAIINNNGEVLCAQRGYGPLIGKWEFPGGKIEKGETEQQALAREIKEELNIEVEVNEFIEESLNEYKDNIVHLKVYKCKHISGDINDTEHQSLKWVKPENMEALDWAEADKPIVETYIESLPRRIEENINFDYFEAEAVKPSNKELQRAAQDYEKSQKAKQKSGELAEEAVLHYERDKLNNLGRPDLADKVKQVSKNSSDLGYDILSYEVDGSGLANEIHIEVKSAKLSSKYVEFFISENELNKFKNDNNHKIYCLIKFGKKYKLHEVNKNDFFRNNYLSPMTYRVRIRVAE